MGDTPPTSMVLGDAAGVTLAGKIMVGTIVTLFFVIVVILGIHIYARLYLWRRNGGAGRRRFVIEDGMVVGNEGLRRGVEPEVLKSMPVVVFSSVEFKDGLECAVCLAEVLDGEKARVLPNCKHGFHVGCIDTWLQSHSTCPICRNPIGVKESEQVVAVSTENNAAPADGAVNFPTNVLFWGNDVHVSSRVVSSDESQSGRPNEGLVIDIPRNNTCDTCSSSSGVKAGDQDELKSPLSGRLRSLSRLWSMNKRVTPSSSASTNLEQAGDERV